MDPDPLLCSLNYLCGILVQAHQAPITINLPTLGSIFAILVALCGLLLSAFNSGSEIAYFSLTADDVEHIEDERQRSRVAWLLSNPERLLSTILIGNNLVNVMIVIVLNFAMNQIFQFNNAVVDFLVQTVILTFLILLFGEVIPKLYATNNNRTFAVMVSGPLCVAVRLFSPLSRILVKGTGIVSKVVSEKADDISMDDLSHALERSDMKSEEEKELLEGILTFGEKTVSEIMRPRIDVVDVDYNDKFTDVVNKVIEAGYSRMPVYDEQPDNIKGILYAKDLLPYIGKRDDDFRWQTLLRPAYFVPETRMIDDLLEDFRKKKMHMAIIVDEYGCTQGIATLEDVLEEIVGDIDDEYDTEEKFYTLLNQNTYMFDGKTLLSDFFRVLDLDDDVLGDATADAETIAGLLLNIKGDFLKENEEVQCGPLSFTVTKVVRYRIAKVKVKINEEALAASANK